MALRKTKPVSICGVYSNESMDCRDFRTTLRIRLKNRWASGAESERGRAFLADLPSELTRHAGACEDCRKRLETVRIVATDLSVPKRDGLSSRVMARIADETTPKTRRPPVWRWGIAAAASVFLVLGSVLVTLAVVDRGDETVVIQLAFEAPQAQTVSVVGDWNGWDPHANALRDSDDDGVWTIEIAVEPGREYQYQFIVDGKRWVPDPNSAIRVDDGFGGTNSVLNI